MCAGTPIGLDLEPFDGAWVDEFLLAGPAQDVCLRLDAPVTRGLLAAQVAARAGELAEAGLGAGGTLALRLPPSFAYVVNLLAGWRLGAQVSLLDHRLTEHEVGGVLARLRPQLVVSAPGNASRALRGHTEAEPVITRLDGKPAETGHSLLQLSSGSTGPSKVIGRTAANLREEVARYLQIDGTPQPGERVVLLSSMVHVLGLVGGLLYCLHAGAQLVLPRSISTDGIVAAVASGPEPATIIGVPFHLDFLTVAARSAQLSQLKRVTVAGELVRPAARHAFFAHYQVPLGVMYGMTEVGVIATDLSGSHWPALTPAPGMRLRESAGQLLLAMPASPYVGLTDPTRWVDGWLHTRDAGSVDQDSGRVTVRGRLDSQVSVGGLKVDLTEVEQTLAALPGVAEVVVAHDGAIEAFVVLEKASAEPEFRSGMVERLAPYKRPRRVNLVDRLPRTATGKLVRSLPQLREVVAAANNSNLKERSGADV